MRPDGKEELEKDGKKPKEGEEGDKDMMAHKLCPHNKPKATCMDCTGCPHGKRRQNCKDCNAGSRQWCQHGKRRHDCHECSGCPHGRIKRYGFCSWLATRAAAPFLALHVALHVWRCMWRWLTSSQAGTDRASKGCCWFTL